MKKLYSSIAILACAILLQGCITYRRITVTNEFGDTVVLESDVSFQLPEKINRKIKPIKKELDRRSIARGSEPGFFTNTYSLMDLYIDELMACQKADAEMIGCGKTWYRKNHEFFLATPTGIDY